ncbi:HEAT repeat-containing protein 2 [Boothiomyces macroporosus]|uniref:HEAT repeat-containing protein 2 n=1 Tax=Boothiomyces macroporosus TaxID=261099 RepID=A0AAD5UFS5_9FUNG|nr:HEAT repeat-containing protein 2 [Boothiomyces macroporosus]
MLEREINIISEPSSDRNSKRVALNAILNSKAVNSQIIKAVTKTLVDPVEKCREISINIVNQITDKELLKKEPSEEIRLQIMKTLTRYTGVFTRDIFPFVGDYLEILYVSLVDAFPEIRKESLNLSKKLCLTCPQHVSLCGDKLVKQILPSLTHRHSSVRVIGVKALLEAVVIDYSALDDCVNVLLDLVRDKASQVRQEVYLLAKEWLTRLIDRHIYRHKMLPLLYAGYTDEMPKLVEYAKEMMEQVGIHYEKENEKEIKDELDYSDGIVRPNRPRVGCRRAARDNIQKITKKLVEMLGDWNVETRYKGAQILYVYIDFCEAEITGYTATIVQPLYKILAEDEVHLMNLCVQVMNRIGYFVSPDTTLSLILPALLGGNVGSFRLGCLRALQGVLAGSRKELLEPQMNYIIESLGDKDLVQNENFIVLLELSKCLVQLVEKIPLDQEITFKFFYLLVQIQSIPGNHKLVGFTDVKTTTESVMSAFASRKSLTLSELYSTYLVNILSTFEFTKWNQYSMEPNIFETVLFKSVPNYADHLDVIVPIFVSCCELDKDIELRDKCISILHHLFKLPFAYSQMEPYLAELLEKVILKNCVWKGGKKHEALRTLSTKVWKLVTEMSFDHEVWLQTTTKLFEAHILPILLSNLDDDIIETRMNMYQEALKRLDDAKDEIRIQSAALFISIYKAISDCKARNAHLRQDDKLTAIVNEEVIEIDLDQVHYETILDCMLIHLDDTNSHIQEAVYKSLLCLKPFVETKTWNDKLIDAKDKHKSTFYLEKLLE